MLSRMKPGLISLALVIVLGVAGVAEACCGTAPNYFITVSIIGTPDCDNGHGGGTVQWKIAYRLPASFHVDKYGDGVVPDGDYYPNPPHTPGATTDILTSASTWAWQPNTARMEPRKVRVQFAAPVDFSDGGEDEALIVFDCTAHGAKNVQVVNE